MTFETVPTLVIGIGGSGLKAVTQVKKSLMEANNNVMPGGVALLVIDTEKEIKYKAGGWGETRGVNRATGPVGIDGAGEYAPITGNIRTHADALRQEQDRAEADPTVRRDQPNYYQTQWFQAKYYFTQLRVSDQTWNLEEGAGRLRQFGRMGAFINLNTILIPRLRYALEYLLRFRKANKVGVQIIGSLAGGTGSSLYADVAHLVQQLHGKVGFDGLPVIIGHFLLGEAFRGTPNVNLGQAGEHRLFDARVYAALRELTRLRGVTPASPYPMIYDPKSAGELSASLIGSPYDSVFLYDGKGSRRPLNHEKIEDGLAPTVADAVLAYLDAKSAGTFQSHTVNFQSSYDAYSIPGGQVTYGTIGTYTIELPIYHITETWAHKLAKEALDILLEPKTSDPATKVPVELRADRPGGMERDATEELSAWLDKRLNSRLVGEIVDWGRTASQSEKIKQEKRDEILGYDANTWKDLLAPGSAVWANLVSDAERELEGSLLQTKGGDSTYVIQLDQGGNTNAQKAQNLIDAVEVMMATMVGRTRSDRAWMREGGRFHRALKVLSAHHDESFARGLVLWLTDTLNGSGDISDARARKAGKLGHAIAFLEGLLNNLKQAYGVLYAAENHGEATRKGQWEALDGEQQELAAELRKQGPGVFDRRSKSYVTMVDRLVQFHKADIARRIVFELISSMQLMAEGALEQLTTWRRALGTAPAAVGGTYALIQLGMDKVVADRNSASRSAVRWVIADDEDGDQYLPAKHSKYSSGQLDNLLKGMVWNVALVDNKGPISVEFVFNQGRPGDGGRESRERRFDPRAGVTGRKVEGEQNAAVLLESCRAAYHLAWSDMNVADYLAQNWAGPKVADLAKRIFANIDLPLGMTKSDKPPMRTTYMRVRREAGQATDNFLATLLSAFRLENGELNAQADKARSDRLKTDEEKGQRHRAFEDPDESQDPFKLSVIQFGDLCMPEDIKGYADAQSNYHAVSGSSDQWRSLHILPAETNALEIEMMLSSGEQRHRQRRRELVEEVTRALEDLDAFELAMLCLAYGEPEYNWNAREARGLLMHQHTPQGNTGARFWRLSLLPEGRRIGGRIVRPDGRPAEPVEFQLCNPTQSPQLLDAIVRFTVQRKSLSDNAPIDMRKVSETIAQARKEHTALWRISEGNRWKVHPALAGDTVLRDEAAALASHIIRLAGFVRNAEKELNAYPWAWQPNGAAPGNLTKQDLASQQRDADLWTALRIVALRLKESHQKRFDELASWIGEAPEELIRLSPPPLVDEPEPGSEQQPIVGEPAGSSDQLKRLEAQRALYGWSDDEFQHRRGAILGQTEGRKIEPPPQQVTDPPKQTPPSPPPTLKAAVAAYVKAAREYETEGSITRKEMEAIQAQHRPALDKVDVAQLNRMLDAERKWQEGDISRKDYDRVFEMSTADSSLADERAALEKLFHVNGEIARKDYEARKAELDRRAGRA